MGLFEERIAKEIVDIAFKLHKTLGPGLLESVYERCFTESLKIRDISYKKQVEIDIEFEGMKIERALRIDLLIENCIIVELKAQPEHKQVWEAQLLSYMKLTGVKLGFIINFHVPLIKEGIKRRIL